jgi:hypothetical protein
MMSCDPPGARARREFTRVGGAGRDEPAAAFR